MKTLLTALPFSVVMAFFDGTEQVLKIEGVSLGEFDPSVHGFYKNVKSFPFDVKKRRAIKVEIKADFPVDIAIANEKGSSLLHKQAVKEGTFGPVSTGDNKEMGIIVGVYPGDKATVSVEVWMVKA
jgi:hypothetical protein